MAKKNNKDVMDLLDDVMPKDSGEKSDQKAKRIIEFMKLADLRKMAGLNQSDIKSFSQPQVSQIENREDVTTLTMSTLIEYAESIGLGIKVVGYSKDDENQEFEILRA